MEPKIHPGALLIVDKMAETRDDDIIIARISEAFLLKRLHIDGSRIILLSDNPAYPPIEITEDMDFEVWARVMHSIQSY